MFFFVFNPDDVAPPTAHFAWATGRSLIDTADGTPDDGDRMTLITDTSAAAADAVQSTSGDRPTWRPADFPGRGGIEVVNARHMLAPVTPTLRWALVICDGANRGWLARDTSATTDHPAISLRVSEDFG